MKKKKTKSNSKQKKNYEKFSQRLTKESVLLVLQNSLKEALGCLELSFSPFRARGGVA